MENLKWFKITNVFIVVCSFLLIVYRIFETDNVQYLFNVKNIAILFIGLQASSIVKGYSDILVSNLVKIRLINKQSYKHIYSELFMKIFINIIFIVMLMIIASFTPNNEYFACLLLIILQISVFAMLISTIIHVTWYKNKTAHAPMIIVAVSLIYISYINNMSIILNSNNQFSFNKIMLLIVLMIVIEIFINVVFRYDKFKWR